MAKTGEKENIKNAISILKKALELEPKIDLYPDTKTRETDPQLVANKFAASCKVEEGKKLAVQGKIEQAINLYNEAQKSDSDFEINASNWAALCFIGSLNNQAQDVLFACEKAVKLESNNSNIQFYRGLARALTGDYQGAIEDFQILVESMKNEEDKARFEGWIESLKKGENSFTSEVLEELKEEFSRVLR